MTLLETARIWKSLGVETFFYKFYGEHRQMKVYLSKKSLEEMEKDPDPALDILAIRITESPLFCLDIDNLGDSISNFHALLEKNGSSIEDFIYEKTRNGGYHIYFYTEEICGNIMHHDFSGVHIDVIFRGNVFTSPTHFGGKGYNWGTRSLSSLNSLKDLGEIPVWLDDFLSL